MARRRGITIESVVIYGALAYALYMLYLKAQAGAAVTVIPPNEPAKLGPAPPVTLQAVRRGSRYYVRR
jgi:hypothetical protein